MGNALTNNVPKYDTPEFVMTKHSLISGLIMASFLYILCSGLNLIAIGLSILFGYILINRYITFYAMVKYKKMDSRKQLTVTERQTARIDLSTAGFHMLNQARTMINRKQKSS